MKKYVTAMLLLILYIPMLQGQGSRQRLAAANSLYGPQFQAYLDRINALRQEQRQAVADSFMAAVPAVPFTEQDTFAYFIYQGEADEMTVPGDANDWNMDAFPMAGIAGTDFWYCAKMFESDARLDYKFVKNGSSWLLDPLNPNKVTGGYGDNSELAMPNYIQPPEIEYYPEIAHGIVEDTTLESTLLENTRRIKIYTPPGYTQSPETHYPVILFHDGIEYTTLASAVNVLDYLIAEKRIRPVVAVFVPPVDRETEYATNRIYDFMLFIIEDVMPYISAKYRTLENSAYRATAGPSYGGLISTQLCYEYPEEFGLCAAYSPSYWANGMQVYNAVVEGPVKEIKFYLDWGSYEGTIMNDALTMRDHLLEKGYDVCWNEWHEGHSWGSWRAHIDNALEYFFPWDSALDVDGNKQTISRFELQQNYPNPFNNVTMINYQLPMTSKVELIIYNLLGQKMTTLVSERQQAGYHRAVWDASRFASGIYFYKITAGDFIQVKRMLLYK
jgi:enterochelin esterase-like enzyme